MSEAEAIQSFVGEIKSALLVPIEVAGRVQAVISLGEMRQTDRFRYEQDDLMFVSTVASALALRIGDFSQKTISSIERQLGLKSEFPDSLNCVRATVTTSVADAINPSGSGVSDPKEWQK
jgi:hypothetical protein